jgi:hypothetical protein
MPSAARYARRESNSLRELPWAEEASHGLHFIAVCLIVLFIVVIVCVTLV